LIESNFGYSRVAMSNVANIIPHIKKPLALCSEQVLTLACQYEARRRNKSRGVLIAAFIVTSNNVKRLGVRDALVLTHVFSSQMQNLVFGQSGIIAFSRPCTRGGVAGAFLKS